MARRLLDLSVLLQNGIPSDPPPLLPEIEDSGHQQLPPQGFMVVYFPAITHRASAGWTRAMTIIDDDALSLLPLGQSAVSTGQVCWS